MNEFEAYIEFTKRRESGELSFYLKKGIISFQIIQEIEIVKDYLELSKKTNFLKYLKEKEKEDILSEKYGYKKNGSNIRRIIAKWKKL